jgi:SAM-dependent methyltransferase
MPYELPRQVYERTLDRLVTASTEWLDIGCGRELLPDNPSLARVLSQRAKLLVGVDPDATILDNRYVHEKFHGMLSDMPPRQFNLVTLRMVAEHVQDPYSLLRSLRKVCAPNARVVVFTPHRWSPMTVASSLTPIWLHQSVKRWLWRTEDRDTFPVAYRMNTPQELRGLFRSHGFAVEFISLLDDCSVLWRWPTLRRAEVATANALRSVGLRYPECCILGIFRYALRTAGSRQSESYRHSAQIVQPTS